MSQAASHGGNGSSGLAGRLGMWIFLFADAMMFAALVSTYAMLRALATPWPTAQGRLNLPLTGVFTFVLICSSVTMVLSLDGACSGRPDRARRFLLLTMLGGAGFLGFQTYEWQHFLAHGVGPRTDLFYACFFALTGFHGFHVLTGLGVLGWLATRRPGDSGYADLVECCALYWHFVDLVWIILFTGIYLL